MMNTKTHTGRRAMATVTVDRQGVQFGPNCWFSHEKITGLTAEQLDKDHFSTGNLAVGNYMRWYDDAMRSAGDAIPITGRPKSEMDLFLRGLGLEVPLPGDYLLKVALGVAESGYIVRAVELDTAKTSAPQTLELRVDASSLVGRLSGTEGIVLDIFAERDRQDAQWGGPDHDDSHSARDWLVYVNKQVETAIGETLSDDTTQLVDPEHYRQRMVKIAALAVAAIESLDRAIPRPLPGEPEPEARQATFQPYEDAAGEFRWRFLALNGQTMADSGEGYATRGNVLRAIDTFRELVADAKVEEF